MSTSQSPAWEGAGATIWPLSHLNDEVEAGKLPEIRVLSDDDIVIAHVLQAMSLELEDGYGLLNA
jgi:hypothetical protein